jgi:hypothetical protein
MVRASVPIIPVAITKHVVSAGLALIIVARIAIDAVTKHATRDTQCFNSHERDLQWTLVEQTKQAWYKEKLDVELRKLSGERDRLVSAIAYVQPPAARQQCALEAPAKRPFVIGALGGQSDGALMSFASSTSSR